jgi:ribosomal-protein-alanine N-acetyltransferase
LLEALIIRSLNRRGFFLGFGGKRSFVIPGSPWFMEYAFYGGYSSGFRSAYVTLSELILIPSMEPQKTPRLSNSYLPFTTIPAVQLETERLSLTALTLSHKELIFETYSNCEIATRYIAWPRSLSPEDGVPFLTLVENSFKGAEVSNPEFSWLIQQKSDGVCIGGCGLGKLTEDSLIGGYILAPSYWGKGYATEVWRELLELAKRMPLVRRVEATHHPGNPQSGNVMQKCGMVRVGEFADIGYFPQISNEKSPSVVWEWRRSD